MKVKTHHRDNVAIISVEGKLMGDTPQLRETLMNECKQNFKSIILDLKGVTWANSAGLGYLISCYSHAKKLGGELVLARVEDTVEMLLKTTGLNKIFRIHKSLDEAIAEFQHQEAK